MVSLCPRRHYHLRIRDHVIELGSETRIMGVLNITPDSFYEGSRFPEPSVAVARAAEMVAEGADFLDIGAESTRPGSQGISAGEELRRLVPVLDAIRESCTLPISVDTSKAEVARAALERGAALINDVTSLLNDPRLGEVAASFGAGLILMHMRGTPADMHLLPPSPDIMGELERWAETAVERAKRSGVSCDRIFLDPGIGFGKSAEQNIEILRNLDRVASFGYPVLVGTSRKSFIGAILNKSPADRIWGSGAAVAASIVFGAHMVRVHDVAAMRDLARVMDVIVGGRPVG
jgi:dihydropteroate synthase